MFPVPFGRMSIEIYAFDHLLQSNKSLIKDKLRQTKLVGSDLPRLARTVGLRSFNKTILVPPNIRLPPRILTEHIWDAVCTWTFTNSQVKVSLRWWGRKSLNPPPPMDALKVAHGADTSERSRN